MMMIWSLLIAAMMTMTTGSLAADASTPHPHQGIIKAFNGAPDVPILLPEHTAMLDRGEVVSMQEKKDGEGRGVAIQDVHASPEIIWSKIKDFDNYPNMVDNVKACKIYDTTDDHIKASFVIGVPLLNVEYFIDHTYRPSEGYMTWTLDYTRQSDLDDSVGFWRVEPIPNKPGWTRLFYSVDVRFKQWVPAQIQDMIATSGLKKATRWVKYESEKAAGHQP